MKTKIDVAKARKTDKHSIRKEQGNQPPVESKSKGFDTKVKWTPIPRPGSGRVVDSCIIKGDPNNLPRIIPEFAGLLPPDEQSYKILEKMILRDGAALAPLVVAPINGEFYLLDGHMRLDILVKHQIKGYHIRIVHNVDSIDAGIWWIIENCLSHRNLNKFQRIEICYKNIKLFQKLAKLNKALAGKHKKNLSELDISFAPIDCLAIMGKLSNASKQTVADAIHILENGTVDEIERCRRGKAISTVRRNIRKRVENSPEWKNAHNAANDDTTYKNPNDGVYVNQILKGDAIQTCKDMQYGGIDNLAAMITSFPYNVGKDYGPECSDDILYDEYVDFMARVIYEAQRLGRDGMRICVNGSLTMNKHWKKGEDLKHFAGMDLAYRIRELNNKYDDCNLLFWGYFNWFKNNVGRNSSVGTIVSPVLRLDSEWILVWVKNQSTLENISGINCTPGTQTPFTTYPDRNDYIITKKERKLYTLQTWQIPPCKQKDIRHPARFPEEIPYRLIKLFTFPGDIILDPCCGSGTTCKVAKKLGRKYIGIDQNSSYCNMARKRVDEVDQNSEVEK